MKWLFIFGAVHGMFTTDQCRVLRQVRLAPTECQAHFAAERSLAANYTGAIGVGRTGQSPAGGNLSGAAGAAGGPGSHPGGGPGGSPGSGGVAGGGSGGAEGGGSPGSPGNPGGGGSPPGGNIGSPPITPPPQKPAIDLADIAKLRGEIRDAVRQRAIDRIINGIKPPDRPNRGDILRTVAAIRAIQEIRAKPGFGDKPGPSRMAGRQPGQGNP